MIKALGAYGGRGELSATTCMLVTENIVIDAGNIFALGADARYIDHILVTHSHMDHITDIPFLIDAYFEYRKKPLKIYGQKSTLDTIKKHIFNWDIWPDFSEIQLIESEHKAVEFIEIKEYQEFTINGINFKTIPVNHTVPCIGYVVDFGRKALFFTSDTYICDNIWNEVNSNPKMII